MREWSRQTSLPIMDYMLLPSIDEDLMYEIDTMIIHALLVGSRWPFYDVTLVLLAQLHSRGSRCRSELQCARQKLRAGWNLRVPCYLSTSVDRLLLFVSCSI